MSISSDGSLESPCPDDVRMTKEKLNVKLIEINFSPALRSPLLSGSQQPLVPALLVVTRLFSLWTNTITSTESPQYPA